MSELETVGIVDGIYRPLADSYFIEQMQQLATSEGLELQAVNPEHRRLDLVAQSRKPQHPYQKLIFSGDEAFEAFTGACADSFSAPHNVQRRDLSLREYPAKDPSGKRIFGVSLPIAIDSVIRKERQNFLEIPGIVDKYTWRRGLYIGKLLVAREARRDDTRKLLSTVLPDEIFLDRGVPDVEFKLV